MIKSTLLAAFALFSLHSAALAKEPRLSIGGISPGYSFNQALEVHPDLTCIQPLSFGSCWTGSFKAYRRMSDPHLEVCARNGVVEAVIGSALRSGEDATILAGEEIDKVVDHLGLPISRDSDSAVWQFSDGLELRAFLRDNLVCSFGLYDIDLARFNLP